MKTFIFANAFFIVSIFIFIGLTSFRPAHQKLFSLTVEVDDLRNNEGSVIFALYSREDAFPDEHYKKYFKKATGQIHNGTSSIIFNDLPEGKYAVNILHDEDNNGKIKKGFILPKEGIGFSNYQSIGLGNKPKFSKAAFELKSDLKIEVKVIYM